MVRTLDETAIITAQDLQVTFERPGAPARVALQEVDLTVTPGEFVAVIGASGAGKTTLLRCLTGFVQPAAGNLVVDGTDVAQAKAKELYALRRRVATIYQHFNLVERATALENVLYGRLGYVSTWRALVGLFPRRDREMAYRHLVELGLGDQALQRVDRLSGGERQRVAIARALVQQSHIILADEPAASLDIALTRFVLETLTRLHRQNGLTVLVNLHDLNLARTYATRIIGLCRGQLVFDGAPDQLTPIALQRIYHVDDNSSENQPTRVFSPAPAASTNATAVA